MADNETNSEARTKELNKFLIISLISTIMLCVVFAGVNYLVMDNLLSQKIGKINLNQEELAEDESSEDEIQRGIIVDLGDFILNLCNRSFSKRYRLP